MKKFKKIISKLVKVSFNQKGLDQSKVKEITKALIKLPKSQNIAGLSLYLKLLKSEISNKTLIIESAILLSNSQKKQILDLFKDQEIIDMENNLNPSLIAGLKVKIGSIVYDGSLDRKIERLRGAIVSHE